MRLLATVILASIFLSIAVTVGIRLNTQTNREKFKSESEDLADLIKNSGIQKDFEITVPDDCKLKFEGENVIARVGNISHHYPTGVPVQGNDLGPGEYELNFDENENGVIIDG